MNKSLIRYSLSVALTLLVFPLMAVRAQSGNEARTFTGEVMDSICSPSGSHATTMAKTPVMGNDATTCTKKCVSMGAKYMLYDHASQTAYSVDNPNKLAPFAGHKVRVSGTLAGSTIDVANVNEIGWLFS